jgi:choline dehydrogenase
LLASRLSEDPSVRVLLLEAGGGDSRKEVHVPLAFSELLKSEADWNYETTPQAGAAGRRLYMPRGRMLGGSSSINAMIYIRGHRSIFNSWAAAGCRGWGWDDLLPLFKRSEDFKGPVSEFHGRRGPLTVSPPRDPNVLSRTFVAAALETGLANNEDFNGAGQLGAGLFHLTQRRGKRRSSAGAFLVPALKRPNLDVVTRALATRVLFDGRSATGLEYRHRNRTEFIAGGQVVLAGGAINSPQLLLLSGVGPAADLEAMDIPVVADLPGVGEGLQDHPVVPLIHECLQPVTLIKAEKFPALAKYLLLRRGPLTSNIAEAGGFVNLSHGTAPDFQFHFAPNYFVRHGFDNPAGHGMSLGATLVLPHSRGRVRLESADPTAPPAIDPACLEEATDLERLVKGFRMGRSILASAAFDEYRGAEIAPGPEAESDEEIAAHVRNKCELLYHPMSTCRMGTAGDTVVDERLSVHGLERISVADASIIPSAINGNTNAASILIGEKAAVLLRPN